ncbi:hypothetical protein HA402_008284 [Bradysia odoriphaga]|nr:hypothetical protein HA402_008284 [Bradysia odoriphaga]
MNNSDDGAQNNRMERQTDEGRCCWVCFATNDDDELAEWVQPCKCSGTARWVHQQCLQRWVDEKQKGNSFRRVNCPQCQTEYIIVFPAMGTLIGVLEGIDTMVKRLSPFLAASVMVGSLYWTAVTYGAVTVLQVIGHKEGLQMMENSDPLVLLIGLPAIPVALIMGRMIRWDDMILRFIQNRSGSARKFPLLSLVLPFPEENTDDTVPNQNVAILSDQLSGTRIFCGALLLPTFSAIFGRLFFESIQNNVHRTLIGGLTFIVIKGAFKIYFKQKQFVRRRQRKILDYTDDNLSRFSQRDNRPAARQLAAVGQFL